MPKQKRVEVATEPWIIRGFGMAGHGLRRLPDRKDDRYGWVRHVHEPISDIYGGDIWEGKKPVCHFTLEVERGADPKQHPTYKRMAALCTFGAAIQNLAA